MGLRTELGEEEKKRFDQNLDCIPQVPNPSVCKLLENRDRGHHSYIPSDWHSVWNILGTEERLKEGEGMNTHASVFHPVIMKT